MIERNVGDIITHDSDTYRGKRLWRIISFNARHIEVEVVKHNFSTVEVGRLMRKMNNYKYILYQPANPNHVTVSSLDYMQSTSLTLEDKQIIKEYLDDKAA